MVEKSLYLVRQTYQYFFYVKSYTCVRNMIRKTNVCTRMGNGMIFSFYYTPNTPNFEN